MYIDTHVNFREKDSYKESLSEMLKIARRAGVDGVFGIPRRPVRSEKELDKISMESALSGSGVFLGVYLGVSPDKAQMDSALDIYSRYFPYVIGLTFDAGNSKPEYSIPDLGQQAIVYGHLAKRGYPGVLAVTCEKVSKLQLDKWKPEEQPSSCYAAHPPEAELESAKDQVKLNLQYKFPGVLYFMDVSLPDVFAHVREENEKLRQSSQGQRPNMVCGITPHHLFTSRETIVRGVGEEYREGSILQMFTVPPLRSQTQQAKNLECLSKGWIHFIQSDHSKHTLKEKLGEDKDPKHDKFPAGIPGIHLGPFLRTKLEGQGLSPERIDSLLFRNAVNIFGLRKNVLFEGKPEEYPGSKKYITITKNTGDIDIDDYDDLIPPGVL